MLIPGKLIVGFLSVFALQSAIDSKPTWIAKPYQQWSEPETQIVLTNSPWAHQVTVNSARMSLNEAGSDPSTPISDSRLRQTANEKLLHPDAKLPSNSSAAPFARVFTVRWLSSVTERQAIARYFLLRQAITEQGAASLVGYKSDRYAIAVGQGVLAPFGLVAGEKPANDLIEQVQKTAYLRFDSNKEKIRPLLVEVPKSAALQPAAIVIVYFPTTVGTSPLPAPADKKVKFACRLWDNDIHAEFDLHAMEVNGRPDLK